MSPAKTDAQRQAERKAREEAAGNKQYKRWVHPDDFAFLDDLAQRLAKRRERACLVRSMTEALDKDVRGKSLIPLMDSDAALLLSRQAGNE